MSSFKIIFSKLEKFTGDGDINLQQWLLNFDRCCVIAEKSDDLMVGRILMLCVDGRAKAILDQFEDEAVPRITASSRNNSPQFSIQKPIAKLT